MDDTVILPTIINGFLTTAEVDPESEISKINERLLAQLFDKGNRPIQLESEIGSGQVFAEFSIQETFLGKTLTHKMIIGKCNSPVVFGISSGVSESLEELLTDIYQQILV